MDLNAVYRKLKRGLIDHGEKGKEADISAELSVKPVGGCCGVTEIHYLYDMDRANIGVEGIFKSLSLWPKIYRTAFIFFSGFEESKRPHKLRDFIIKHNLGEVWESEERLNHNSGNKIKVFVWSPEMEDLKDFVSGRYGWQPWSEEYDFRDTWEAELKKGKENQIDPNNQLNSPAIGGGF